MFKKVRMISFLLYIFIGFSEGQIMSKNFELKSDSFQNEGNIPPQYTCDGKNISPQLSWLNVPQGTKELVLIVDDPDAKKVVGKTFVHWIVKDISLETNQIPENASKENKVPGPTEVTNDGKPGKILWSMSTR